MAAAVVLAVAAMVPAVAMADVVDDLASTSPAHEKTLKDNGDGTYDLTLSVSGDAEQTDRVKPVDIVLVVDASTSMNWKIDGIGSKTHMQAAHDAAAFAEELLTAENANLPKEQQTRISVVTFGVKADLAQGYSTNAEDISKAVPTKAKYFEGDELGGCPHSRKQAAWRPCKRREACHFPFRWRPDSSHERGGIWRIGYRVEHLRR